MTAPVKCNVTSTVTQQDPQKETTKDFYKTCNLPPRWDRPYWFTGYGCQQVPLPHPFYRSTYMDYGW
ncbi:hypothetical protein Phum_PHUM397450 [Pediculus humanus corporis]|uniref:Uncharacterized protein n=1 Tax=Pediculus humanus subsp. corporis TaxID=121224 RepID=E0VRG2_PEDHC|nr:uncharacterized protein Phum_PHUM397450 [Pediculus humanus corporis]EEB15968.1 hypothetical protein Phum_PHUM397450 [Pediculus humanus corporis]